MQLEMIQVYQVDFIESERGWGSKVDFTEYYEDLDDAKKRVKEFNSKNTAKVVPDWYMYATDPKPIRYPKTTQVVKSSKIDRGPGR